MSQLPFVPALQGQMIPLTNLLRASESGLAPSTSNESWRPMNNPHLSLITYPAILVAVFARQMCLPVPAVLVLIMAGALGASGRMSLTLIVSVGVVGCLLADYIWFQVGRWWGSRVLRILCSFSADPNLCTKRARKAFAQWGLRILMVAKFIPGLDGLMPPLSGLEGAGSLEFLFFDGIGALLWCLFYSVIGYCFASRVEIVATILGRASTVVSIVVLGPFLGYVCWRAWELMHMLGRLRLRTISPALLHEKLASGERVAVLDLLLCEGDAPADAGPSIPGAIRVNPTRLRKAPHVTVPPDVEVVLYCSSPRAVTSARVAVALRHKGVRRIKVLEGGLNEWRNLKLPLTATLADPEEERRRLGITISPGDRKRLSRVLHETES